MTHQLDPAAGPQAAPGLTASRGRTHRALVRAATSAAVAAGMVGLLTLAGVAVARSAFVADLPCQRDSEWGCLGLLFVGIYAAMLAGAALMWPALWLAGVRPAWPVALLGPFVFVALNTAALRYGLPFRTGSAWAYLVVRAMVPAVGYGIASVVTMPGGRRAVSLGLLAAVVAVYVWAGPVPVLL